MLNFNEADEQFSGSQQSDFSPIQEGTIVDVLLTICPFCYFYLFAYF